MNEYEEALKMAQEAIPFRTDASNHDEACRDAANAMMEQRALEAERAAKVLSDEGFVGLPREVTGRAAYLRGLKKA